MTICHFRFDAVGDEGRTQRRQWIHDRNGERILQALDETDALDVSSAGTQLLNP